MEGLNELSQKMRLEEGPDQKGGSQLCACFEGKNSKFRGPVMCSARRSRRGDLEQTKPAAGGGHGKDLVSFPARWEAVGTA